MISKGYLQYVLLFQYQSTVSCHCSIKTDKKKAQRKDRVYTHLQNQIAEQAASRAAKKDKEGERANIELFVDRQRQAAVVLGERDLAGDVKAKRRRDK